MVFSSSRSCCFLLLLTFFASSPALPLALRCPTPAAADEQFTLYNETSNHPSRHGRKQAKERLHQVARMCARCQNSQDPMNPFLQALSYARSLSFSDWSGRIKVEDWLAFVHAFLLNVDMRVWYLLVFCCSAAFLSRIAVEFLAPSPPQLVPAKSNEVKGLPTSIAAELQPVSAVASIIQSCEGSAVDASLLDSGIHQRLRALELQCDALRAEAQRSSRLEAELAAANIRIEDLTRMVSLNQSASTPRASCSDTTPLKISHRTPSSAAAKSLTIRASVLQKAQVTPTSAVPSQLY